MANESPSEPQPHHCIDHLSVSGGFLDGARFEFVDGLNCLIGGRGAGKTTALEFLRFALGIVPHAETHADRAKALEALVRENLGKGQIVASVRTKMQMAYTADRRATGASVVRDAGGTPVPISLVDNVIFGADIFSQNEVEEIATDPDAQLVLLDRFAAETIAAIRHELMALQRELEENAETLERLDGEVEKAQAQAAELPMLQERLKGYEQATGPDAAVLTAAQSLRDQRQRESTMMEQLSTAARAAVQTTEGIAGAYRGVLSAHFDSDMTTGPNAELAGLIERDARAFLLILEAAASAITTAAGTFDQHLAERATALQQAHAQQDAQYQATVASYEQQGGQVAERERIREHLNVALAASKEADAKIAQRGELIQGRARLTQRLSEARDRRFEARKAVAEKLTQAFDGGIRILIEQAGNLEKYRNILVQQLSGHGMQQRPMADKLIKHFTPAELAASVGAGQPEAFEKLGWDASRSQKVIAALRNAGGFRAVECVEVDDLPRIELRDGSEYKDSARLSTGQRCTTILPIVLMQNDRPLLVDQPEDNLDNAFVYETIVKSIRRAKGQRQIIFVTHNPNIPVLGEADRTFVLDSDGQRARIKRVGTVDECKADIESILEGGRDAFLKRKERYGH
jgi:energy-coupling factor transporter ATP-binding protein EcfA2